MDVEISEFGVMNYLMLGINCYISTGELYGGGLSAEEIVEGFNMPQAEFRHRGRNRAA